MIIVGNKTKYGNSLLNVFKLKTSTEKIEIKFQAPRILIT